MDHKAAVLALLLVSSTLAGCTGDPDAGGGDEFDSEALQDLIDENLQDFLNNTTITVINNYHNNTTYVIDDSSNTSYNFGGASFGSGANGTVTGGNMMFVAHVTFTAMDLFPDYEMTDYRNNTFTHNYTYYDYLTNQERTDDFTFGCQVYYLIGSLSNGSSFQVSYWEMAANGSEDNYWNAWENEYNSTIADLLQQAGYAHDVRSTCDEDYNAAMPIVDGASGYEYNFLSIDIPQGYAIEYIQLDANHRYYGCGNYFFSYYRCVDSSRHGNYSESLFYTYSEGVEPWNDERYYGGWDNITIDFDLKLLTFGEYQGYSLPYSESVYYEGMGYYSIWPTSTYEFTLYYQFVPVVPVS
jgi:hypothetical protein